MHNNKPVTVFKRSLLQSSIWYFPSSKAPRSPLSSSYGLLPETPVGSWHECRQPTLLILFHHEEHKVLMG